MTLELAAELDDRLAFVLGSRCLQALDAEDWDGALRAIGLLEPVIARLNRDRREDEYRRYLLQLARALPSEHPRKEEMVSKATPFLNRATENVRPEPQTSIPVGVMTPLPLPGRGEPVESERAKEDLKTIKATVPEFSLAIRNVEAHITVSTLEYFPGWHCLECFAILEEQPVASIAFFVNGDDVAPIAGNGGVFQAIARRDGIALKNEEIAKAYLLLYVAASTMNAGAGRIVEPGDPLPFHEEIDEATKAAAREKLQPCEVSANDAGGYAATGCLAIAGVLAHFDAVISANGEVEFNATPIYPNPEDDRIRQILVNYIYTPQGWRILGRRDNPLVQHDPVASGLVLPTELPSTLPDPREGDDLLKRPCVVAPPSITTFAGLPLRGSSELDSSLLSSIPRTFDTATIQELDLAAARIAALPFLPGFALALVPHRETAVSVPFVVGDGKAILVGRQNSWLYSLMEREGSAPTMELLAPYARFFFSVIIGRLGKFTLVESIDEIEWAESATEEDKKKVADVIQPVLYLGRQGNGRHVLSMHVIFKDALFRTNCNIAANWETELDHEDLILEDQPFLSGPAFNLTVYR